MDAFFGPGGRLAAALAGFEPRAEQAALAAEVAERARERRAPRRRGRHGHREEPRLPGAGAPSGQRVVVATATKALQEQLLTKDVPAAAAALGRDVRVAVLKGRQNYLCRKSSRLRPARRALPHGRGRGRLRAPSGLDRDDGDRRPRRARLRAVGVAVGRARRRRRPLRRPPLPLRRSCFAEEARERAGEAELVIANHALYFADLALRTRTDGAASCRSTTRSSSTRRTASRKRPPRGSAAGSRSRGCAGSRATWSASAARQSRTPPARPLAEVERAGRAPDRRPRPGSGRRRLPGPTRRRSRSSASCSRPRSARSRQSSRAAARTSTRSRGARSSRPRTSRLPRARRSRPRRLGRARRASRGRRSTSRASSASALGSGHDGDARLRDARPALRPPPARARRGARARRCSPFDFREQALLYVPTACPSRAPPATRAARGRGRRALPALARAARSC